MNKLAFAILAAAIVAAPGCTTKTRRFAEGESRQTVAGFSEEDINDTISRAKLDILALDCIKTPQGSNRAIVIVKNVVNDTNSRGRDASALAEVLGQSLREELTSSGRIVVYNEEVAPNAKVMVEPQYRLSGRLTERNLRQDDGDAQKEYNLNLTFVELATGLEFWQKRVHVGKIVDKTNIMY
jgi:PBP1b-binding outer membrane lipoprotein LpoB